MLNVCALPPGEVFFDELAAQILDHFPGPDLSVLRILVPTLPVAAELRAALVRAARGPLLLPPREILCDWARNTVLAGIPEPLPESERRVLLHEALRQKGWFDEPALWGIASEMADLFDELTHAAVRLPDDEADFAECLRRAYATRDSAPLAFEARVVHDLWRALATSGAADAVTTHHARLAELARRAARTESPQPLLMLLDAAPEEALDPAERDFLSRYATTQPLWVFFPEPREACATPLSATLAAAWPEQVPGSGDGEGEPLLERARALAREYPESPLCGRLTLLPTVGREQEARAAVAQVGVWLAEGLRR
ncbi:MAG: Inactivated superfamily I helicase, partial [Candidatus Accumulibacter sp.]|nr:Inactivated superfamily I helicase [Accumulibacter sp.]